MQNIKILHLVQRLLIRNVTLYLTHMIMASTETTWGLSSGAVMIHLLTAPLNKWQTNVQWRTVLTRSVNTLLVQFNCRLAYLACEHGSGSSEFAKAEDLLHCPTACSYVPQTSSPICIFGVWYDIVFDPSDRAVEGVGLQPLASWNCWFETRRGQGCLFLVSVVCVAR
jgi:hypothetical protein